MANETPSNTATLLMRIDTGSINEKPDELGLAHFLEHMAFNGSENIPEGEMISRLEKFGLAFGPDTNASTDFEETIFQLELPEVNDDILDETLMIMRETAERLLLDPEAIDRERGVILSEKRARESPGFNAFVASLSYYLKDSLFPDRLPIGTEETIKTINADQFRAFYKGYYRPENTFIVLVGDFEVDYAADKISDFFADWSPDGMATEPVNTPELAPAYLQMGYYTHPEIQTSVSINMMTEPDLRADTRANRRDFYIEQLGNRILTRRLSRLAQDADAAFISASARTSTIYDTRTISSVQLNAQPEQWAEALAAGEQALRRAVLYGFTQSELDEQIANTRNALEVSVQTSPTQPTPALAQEIVSSFSGNTTLTSAKDDLARFESYAHMITPQQVNMAFKRLWKDYDRPNIYLSTSRVIDDAEAVILETLKQSQTVNVVPNIQTDVSKFAYTEFGDPGTVKARQTIEDIGFESLIFENNVRLNIKKTPYEKGVVNIEIAFGKGELFLPEDNPGLRWFVPNIMDLAGLDAHSADDIQTLMAGKTVGASFSLGTKRQYLSGTTTVEDLPEQLNLMTAYLTAPGFRAEAKSRYDKFISSFYPTLDSTPSGVASREIERLLRSGDKRFGIPTEEDLVNVEIADLKTWIIPQLKDSAIEISIVGDANIDRIITDVARTFGALTPRKSDPSKVSDGTTALTFPQGDNRPVTLSHSGEPGTALLRIYWPAPDGQNALISRQLGVLSDVFQLKITEALRESSGASYSPSAFKFSPRTYPDYGYIGVSVEVSPDNIESVAERVHAIAASLKQGQISDDLFQRAIRPLQEQIESSLQDNGYWLDLISESQVDPERLARHRTRFDTYENMTADDVSTLAQTLFNPGDSVTYYILPED